MRLIKSISEDINILESVKIVHQNTDVLGI